MRAAFRRCLGGLVSREGDAPHEISRKLDVLFLGLCTAGPVAVLYFAWFSRASLFRTLGTVLTCIPGCALVAYILKTRSSPGWVLEVAVYFWSSVVLMAAYVNRTTGYSPPWGLIVVLLDYCLVNCLPSRTTTVILVSTVVTLTLYESLELIDVAHSSVHNEPHICDCTDPPCRVGPRAGLVGLALNLFALLLNFYLTHGFARQAEQEQQAMQSTIDTMQMIAQHLAVYDVDSVAEILASDILQLPEEMHTTLQALEQNLRTYRTYLPDGLFEQIHSTGVHEGSFSRVVAPDPELGDVTIVFTDVRSSTLIWEAVPDAMKRAMATHNDTIRCVMQACGGYEVKIVGDAFMVAFDNPVSGVNFALRIHAALLSAKWPTPLYDLGVCSRRSSIWGGLTVRVGVNSGPVVAEENEVTLRTDYFGHTVNVAARLEGECTPGSVGMPTELWQQVSVSCDAAVTGPRHLVRLKGVRDPLLMCCLWPAALRERELHSVDDSGFFTNTNSSGGSSHGSVVSRVIRCEPLVKLHATFGMVQMLVDDLDLGHALSQALEVVSFALSRNSGMLVSVLGNYVSVGWNISRRQDSHAESAVHFARYLQTDERLWVGLCSGVAHHGNIGSLQQRFVTAAGDVVRASWLLSEAALCHGLSCLFMWLVAGQEMSAVMQGLPTALKDQLQHSEADVYGFEDTMVYELVEGSFASMSIVRTHSQRSGAKWEKK